MRYRGLHGLGYRNVAGVTALRGPGAVALDVRPVARLVAVGPRQSGPACGTAGLRASRTRDRLGLLPVGQPLIARRAGRNRFRVAPTLPPGWWSHGRARTCRRPAAALSMASPMMSMASIEVARLSACAWRGECRRCVPRHAPHVREPHFANLQEQFAADVGVGTPRWTSNAPRAVSAHANAKLSPDSASVSASTASLIVASSGTIAPIVMLQTI